MLLVLIVEQPIYYLESVLDYSIMHYGVKYAIFSMTVTNHPLDFHLASLPSDQSTSPYVSSSYVGHCTRWNAPWNHCSVPLKNKITRLANLIFTQADAKYIHYTIVWIWNYSTKLGSQMLNSCSINRLTKILCYCYPSTEVSPILEIWNININKLSRFGVALTTLKMCICYKQYLQCPSPWEYRNLTSSKYTLHLLTG